MQAVTALEFMGKEKVTKCDALKSIRTSQLNRDNLKLLLAQYWEPLHFFPTFLASLVAKAPSLKDKTLISAILFQELGEGNLSQAHETLYLEITEQLDLPEKKLADIQKLPATQKLMAGYKAACHSYNMGLGFLYATEVIDLAVVSSIGAALRKELNIETIAWIDIHVRQEPHHVICADASVLNLASNTALAEVKESAETAWKLWHDFFGEIVSLNNHEN